MERIYRLIIVLGLSFTPIYSYSQISIQPHLIMPTGYLGAVLKKAPGLRIGWIKDFEGKWRSRIVGDIFSFTPRKEVFDVYGVVSEGSEETVYPGTQRISLHLNLEFTGGLDFKLLGTDQFFWYLGGDIAIGMTFKKSDSSIKNISSESEFSGIPYFGIRGRTGVEYQFEKFALFVDYDRIYYLNLEPLILDYNSLGLGVRIQL